MANVKFEVKDNTDQVISAIKNATQSALKDAGEACRGYAVYNSPVRTGALRSSFITEEEGDDTVAVGVPEGALKGDYAKYVEFGTSRQRAQHMLQRAVQEHIPEYKRIIESRLASAVK